MTATTSSPRSKLRWKGLLEGRPRVGPESVHVDVANACNTNCVTCWDHSPHLLRPRTIEWRKQKTALERFREIVDDAAELGAEAVVISGQGEPFINSEVYDMIAHAAARGLHVTAISNVLLVDPERAVAAGLKDLLASVNGSDEASYLAFHPNLAARDWASLLAKLARLRDLGLRAKHVQVVDAANVDLVAMVELAARLGAKRVNWKLASTAEGTEVVAVGPGARRDLREVRLPAALARARELGVETNGGAFHAQLAASDDGTRTAPIEENGCFMGYFYARVLVDGTVLYCCNTDVVVGQLDERTRFKDLWSGPSWQAWRDRLRKGDYPRGCDRCGKWVENRKLAEKLDARAGRPTRLRLIGRAP